MFAHLEKRSSQDRNPIAMDRDVQYWANKFGVTADELKEAVSKVGPMARDVSAYFSRAKA